jgi:Reverse transcriptase (RNA-dependent DNA polymerase)
MHAGGDNNNGNGIDDHAMSAKDIVIEPAN